MQGLYDENAVFDEHNNDENVEVYDDISVMIVITKMRTVTIKTNDFTNGNLKIKHDFIDEHA